MMGQNESRRRSTFEEDDEDDDENDEGQQGGRGSPKGLPLITPYAGRRATTSRFKVSSSAVTSLVSSSSNTAITISDPAGSGNSNGSSGDSSGNSNSQDSSTNDDGTSSALSDSSSGMGGVDEWIERLYQCKALAEGDAIALCNKAKEVLLQEPSVKHIQAPVSVCGDIHGQVGCSVGWCVVAINLAVCF